MENVRRKCVESDCYGTTWTSRFLTRRLFLSMCLAYSVMICLNTQAVSGQYNRRPSGTITPALEAFRNRWMDYLKQRSSTTTRPITRPGYNNHHHNNLHRNQNEDALVINGFTCERTYALFPNKSNPRMYHLCARRGDGWFIYHYFCPHGTQFEDRMKKCMHEPSSTITSNTERATIITSTTVRVRRPSSSLTTATSSPPPTSLSTVTRTTRITSTTTEEEPVPEAEPGVTESGIFSSEESSTEDEMPVGLKDVVVSLPGFVMTAASNSEEDELVTSEKQASNEINVNSESANGQQSGLTTTQSKKPTKTKTFVSTSSGGVGAAGGRRPRLLKKWRLQYDKY